MSSHANSTHLPLSFNCVYSFSGAYTNCGRMDQLHSCWADFLDILNLRIFRILRSHFNLNLNWTCLMTTLHDHLSDFLAASLNIYLEDKIFLTAIVVRNVT